MAKIVVKQAHNKSEQAVRELVEDLQVQLRDEFDLEGRWQSDTVISFKRSGVSGELCIEPNCVVVSLKLGMMLGMYANKIQRKLETMMAEKLSD